MKRRRSIRRRFGANNASASESSKSNFCCNNLSLKDAESNVTLRLTTLLSLFASSSSSPRSSSMDMKKMYNHENQEFAHQILRLVFSDERDSAVRWYVNAESELFKRMVDSETLRDMLSDVPRRRLEDCTQQEESQDHQSAFSCSKEKQSSSTRTQLDKLNQILAFKNIVPYNQNISKEKENEGEDESTMFYYVLNFESVPPKLLENRLVLLSRGTAFVPSIFQMHLCVHMFQIKLKRNLYLARKIRPRIFRKDPRLEQICKQASAFFQKRFRYVESSSTSSVIVNAVARQDVARANIDLYASRSMPLCMYSLFEELQRSSHLKYDGRFQLQGFLKGIGFTLQDSLKYWRQAFSRNFTPREFEKKYAYSIRHYYGKVGKRYDRPPLDCDQIITKLTQPGPGQFHGCPFKYWGESALRTHLNLRDIRRNDVNKILGKVQEKDYQASCREYFRATHEGSSIAAILEEDSTVIHSGVTPSEHHPNLYFEASEIFFKSKELAGRGGEDEFW